MVIARSTGALLGVDESVGATLTSGETSANAQVDVLGDATSTGVATLYLVFTPAAPASGELDVTLYAIRANGAAKFPLVLKQIRLQGASGQQKACLGRVPVGRYASATVFNNSDKTLVGVSLLYELEKTT